MDLHIRPFCEDDMASLVQLSLLAFEPVFSSFEQVLGRKLYPLIYPDWRASQSKAVEATCRDEKMSVWVAEADGVVIGYLAYDLNLEDKSGEVQLLAVHPDYQNLGIGTELNTFALGKMRESGIKLVSVGTGGDPSHTPARRSYEKSGYTALPLVRYYKELTEL